MTFNDFPAFTAFGAIAIAGSNYTLSGNTASLLGGVNSIGSGNSLNLGIRLSGAQGISQSTSSTLIVQGGIDLNGHDLSVSSDGVLQLDGIVSGDGSLTTFGEVVLSGANTYTGLTTVSVGTLRVRNGQALGSKSSGTSLEGRTTLQLENDIVIDGESLSANAADPFASFYNLVNTGNNRLLGKVDGGLLIVRSFSDALQIDGSVNVSNLFVVAGRVLLNGEVNGLARVENGILEINATARGGFIVTGGARVSGSGTIAGSIFWESGVLAPGTAASTGVLRIPALQLNEFSSYDVRLNGPVAGAQYDQSLVNGSITLDVPKLNIELGLQTLIAGTEFRIVDNDGTDAVTGVFKGLGEGSIFAVGARLFKITYKGGDGNDIVLTVLVGDRLPPTDISLSNITIAENSSDGALVGSLSTRDPDANDAFTYHLIDDAEGVKFFVEYNDFDGPNWTGIIDTGTDNLTITSWAFNSDFVFPSLFSTIWPAVKLSYHPETSTAYSYYETTFVDIPDDWSGDMHRDPIVFWYGSVIQDFYGGWGAAYRQDQGVYDVMTGPVGILGLNRADGRVVVSQPDVLRISRREQDPPAFRIAGNQLVVNSTLDFEANSSHTIRIRSTDAGGLSFEKTFVINVTDVNEAPTNIELTTNIVPENSNANVAVAALATIDQDGDDTFSYSLVSGAGGDDNDRFSIVAGKLFARASFDFESKNNYSIRVRSTDAGGLSVEKSLSIIISDVNESPSAINLSDATIAENSGVGALVGTLSATDPDRTDSFSYALVSGPGSDNNAMFQIVGNELRTLANFEYEAKNAYTVRIRLTDAAGFTLEKAFTISVTDEVDTVALPGDTNRDGIFNSTDLILAFQAGEYEDTIAGNSVWTDGDWNGDGEFDSSDIVFAFQRSVYVLDDVFGAIAARWNEPSAFTSVERFSR